MKNQTKASPLSLSQLASIEVPGAKVSEKYVLVKSTDIIDILSPEFKFLNCTQWGTRNSTHTVDLELDGDTISFENSFDRSSALRFRLGSRLYIPLIQKQIHLGKNAEQLIESITESKQDIIQSIKDAKNLEIHLKNTNIPDFIKEELIELIFVRPLSNENFIELDLDIKGETFYKYIVGLEDAFVNGTYNVVVKVGKDKKSERIRKGWKLKDNLAPLKTQQKIYKYLKEQHPMIFI